MKKTVTILLFFLTCLTISAQVKDSLTSGSEKKDTIATDTTTAKGTIATTGSIAISKTLGAKELTYVRKVYDNAVYTQNIVSDIDLELKGLGKQIPSLNGKLQMRRDQVIRICVHAPFIGTEIARLEFTPNYVLLMDRWHGKYVKESYDNVEFLKSEGLTFFTLQSLFWNELYQPGKEKLSESDFSNFLVNMNALCIRFKTKDTLYRWNTNSKNQITYSGATYAYNSPKSSTVTVNYDDFSPVGVKNFPKKIFVTFNSKAFTTGALSLNINMDGISTDSDWTPQTIVPSRYTQMSPEEFFQQLGSL